MVGDARRNSQKSRPKGTTSGITHSVLVKKRPLAMHNLIPLHVLVSCPMWKGRDPLFVPPLPNTSWLSLETSSHMYINKEEYQDCFLSYCWCCDIIMVDPEISCVRKRNLLNLTNVVSQRLYCIKMKVINMLWFCHVLNIISFPMKVKLTRSNFMFVCMRFRIRRYVASQCTLCS